jgi:hypothetical protein
MNNQVYYPPNKLLTNFKKHITNKLTLLLFFLFLIFTTTTFAQGTTCGTATPLTINGACDSGLISDATQNTPNISGCSFSNFRREGWYTFTVTGGPLNITITASAADYGLYLQLISSTSSCTGLAEVTCQNATGNNNSAHSETITTSLANGIYYVKVVNEGGDGDMTLNSICVTSPIPPANNLCTNATALPCGTTNLAGTTVNTANIAHGTGCSMSNYGVWYTFVGDGNPTTITTNPAFDIKLSVSTGTCASMTNIVCTDSSPEQATFTTVNGTTYYVYVADWLSSGTTTGTFTISRSCITCAPPTATAATNVTFTTATVNWNAPTAYTPSNGYQYAVTTSATPPGSGTATTATSVNVNSLIANTVYYLHVRSDCNANGFSTWSTISFITGYCASTSSSSTYWISNFSTTLGSTNINRNSTYTVGGYANYSATDIVTQIIGQSFNFSTTMSSGTHGINIYVDWNNDFDFNDAGELAFASGTSYVASATGTITIPNGTSVGNHRMRVVTNYSSTNPSSCGSNTYTETEDYTINAVAPPACTGAPSGGTAVATPASASPGSSYTVSASGFTNATGLTFQWQSNTNAGGWINVGASSGTYSNYSAIAPALGTTVLWRLVVTCTSSGQSGTSTNGTFNSVSIQNIPSTGSNTVTCGTNIVLYDNGGSTGDYANSSSGYTVLEAGLSSTITISGNYVTESIDYIRIYNGTGTGGTLLATYSGTGTINYTGTAGQTLTIQFTSDSSIVYSGFGLSVSYSGICFPACSGTPTAGTVTTTPSTGWSGTSYSVVASGYTQALNMTYQWQYSSNPGGPWTNAGVATSSYANYIATAPASGLVYWHLVVTCTNTSQTAISSNGLFTTMTVSTVVTGCPNVVSGGLGLSGADPAAVNCTASSTCVDLEATYLDLGETTDYIVEPIAYNPPFSFNGLANPVSVNIDDRWSSIVNLPFDFCFYGNTYDSCLVGSNGVITFDTTSNTPTTGTCDWEFDSSNPGSLPISGHSSLIENAIFGVFHDINPALGGEIGWELITLPTGCQALVAAWNDVPMYSCTSSLYSGMMVLYENSNIIEIYVQEKNVCATWNDGNAVIGIQNATGTLASVAPGRNGLDTNWTTTNEAWRFVPNGTSIASIAWHEGAGITGPIVGTNPTLTVCPASTTIYTAEITYTLCDGRTIKETDQTTVTINGAKVWNGSVSTNWNIANNWTPTGVPTSADCVVIPNVANDPIIGGTNYSGLGLNLAVNTDAILNITATNALKITDVINVNPTGTIIVQDDASIVQINNVPNTGNIQYQRNTNIRRQDYVYWSTPVANFASNAVSPGTSLGYQYKWIPTIATNTGEFGNWTFANETMVSGKGYCLRAPDSYSLSAFANYTATFVGVPNNGNITTPISRGTYTGPNYNTGVSTTLGTQDDDNWNLVGNPYPSAIHAVKFLTLNPNIAGFVNIWTHGSLPSSATADPFYNNYAYNYTPADYITYNSTGSSSGAGTFNGFIGGGQGFFISMLHGGATTQNLNFDNTLRRDVPTGNTYDNGQFFKTANKNSDAVDLERHRIWFDIVTPSGTSARALLGYVENATDQNDRLFDAFSNEKLSFNIFSLIEDEKMLIQGRKLPFDVNDKVNIGVSIPQDGLYKIALGSVDGLFLETKQNIYLEDKLLNVIFSLKDAPYSFMSNKGTIKDRFVLRYTKSDKITELTNQLTVFDNNVLTVESGKLKIKDIVIFDTLGKLLLNKNNVNRTDYQITNLNRTNSMLIVKVTLEDNTEEVRKIIY